MVNERSLVNLRPQKAGEPSHNPNGRKKKELSITSIAKEMLEATAKCEDEKISRVKEFVKEEWGIKDPTWAQLVTGVWIIRAIDMKQHPAMLTELVERVDGKATQRIKIDEKVEHIVKAELSPEDAAALHRLLRTLPGPEPKKEEPIEPIQ